VSTATHTIEPPDWVRDFYADVDAGLGAEALARMTADVTVQFGARPVASGREAAGRTLAAMHASFDQVSHEFRNVWVAGGTVICEFIATYRLHDGSLLPLPSLTVLTARGEQIASMRVYIGEAPLIERAKARRG
jgi:ketosteroid isomerase-like protein